MLSNKNMPAIRRLASIIDIKGQHKMWLTFLLWRSSLQELIEYVETALILGLSVGARLLQQIAFDVGSADETGHVEVDTNEFSLKGKV